MFKETGGKSWLLFLCLLVAEIQISVQPQSQQAAVCSRVLLTCRAFGPPDLNYQWFRGKEEVRGFIIVPVLLSQTTLLCHKLVVWLVISSDLRGERNFSRVDSVPVSTSPPGSLYLSDQQWNKVHLFPVGSH